MVEIKQFLIEHMYHIGWFGNSLLAICGLPQAFKSYKNGHSKGVSRWFLWTWVIGEVFAFAFHLLTSDNYPQVMNYVMNLGFISIVIYYSHFPRISEEAVVNKETNNG